MENSRIWDGKTEDFMQRARGITEQGTHGASGANLKSWKFFTQCQEPLAVFAERTKELMSLKSEGEDSVMV